MAVTKVPYKDTTAMGVYLEFGMAPVDGAKFSLQIKAGQPASIMFPSTVTILEGETGVQFAVTWAIAGTTILQAQLVEYGSVPPDPPGEIFEVDIEALAGAALTQIVPTTGVVQEGLVALMTVVMSREVTSDTDVTLLSSNPSVGTVPSFVTVPTGSHVATFDFTALSVGSTTITASYDGVDKQATGQVEAVEISSVSPDDFEILVTETYTASVFFEDLVVRDETVTLESDDTNIATVPASVVVATGQQSAEFDVVAVRLGTATITATHATGVKTSDLTVIAKGYGPAAGEEGPRGTSALELVPRPIGAEREYD